MKPKLILRSKPTSILINSLLTEAIRCDCLIGMQKLHRMHVRSCGGAAIQILFYFLVFFVNWLQQPLGNNLERSRTTDSTAFFSLWFFRHLSHFGFPLQAIALLHSLLTFFHTSQQSKVKENTFLYMFERIPDTKKNITANAVFFSLSMHVKMMRKIEKWQNILKMEFHFPFSELIWSAFIFLILVFFSACVRLCCYTILDNNSNEKSYIRCGYKAILWDTWQTYHEEKATH